MHTGHSGRASSRGRGEEPARCHREGLWHCLSDCRHLGRAGGAHRSMVCFLCAIWGAAGLGDFQGVWAQRGGGGCERGLESVVRAHQLWDRKPASRVGQSASDADAVKSAPGGTPRGTCRGGTACIGTIIPHRQRQAPQSSALQSSSEIIGVQRLSCTIKQMKS